MIARAFACLVCMSCAALAQDIVVLGEVHDNLDHHRVQAEEVSKLAPAALVFEMLSAAQADGAILDHVGDAGALGAALGWAESGWPDFDMYYPIFAAAPEARVYGAGVTRSDARGALEGRLSTLFGPQAEAYSLLEDLPSDQRATRFALQMSAHCDAIPEEMLPSMVDIQRLRDATLARVALQALEETGGPVAVITGNGHARPDWGVPSYLARVSPDTKVQVIGQTEGDAALEGGFDTVLSSPAPDREDPCDAFR